MICLTNSPVWSVQDHGFPACASLVHHDSAWHVLQSVVHGIIPSAQCIQGKYYFPSKVRERPGRGGALTIILQFNESGVTSFLTKKDNF